MARKRNNTKKSDAEGTLSLVRDGDVQDASVLSDKAAEVDGSAGTDLHQERADVSLDDTGSMIRPAFPIPDKGDDNEAIMTLQSLERVIGELQVRWAEVEVELSGRDMEIARLEEDREIQHAAFRSVQMDLDASQEREEDLAQQIEKSVERLAALQDELVASEKTVAEKDQIISARLEEIEKLKADWEAARRAQDELKASLAEERKAAESARQDTGALHETISALRVTVQDLETYIDGRSAEWGHLHKDLDSYRDTLAGMKAALEEKDARIQQQEDEKIALSLELVGLQKQCAQIDGRRAEREAVNQELQEQLARRVAEIDRLRDELRAAQQSAEPLLAEGQKKSEELSRARADVDRLNQALVEVRREAAEHEGEILAVAERNAALVQSTLDAATAENMELTERLAETDGVVDRLLSDAAKSTAQIEELTENAVANEIALANEVERRDSLQEALEIKQRDLDQLRDEFAGYRDETGQEIEAMRQQLTTASQRVEQLEKELEERRSALRSLSRNVEIVDEINASAKRLDRQMAAGAAATTAQSNDKPSVRRLMVALSGQKKIRFPIYKQCTTIGRSPSCDIQVRQKWISREHARIVVGETGVIIEDLGSKNGILVNNQPVTSASLSDNDLLDIGETRFQFIELAKSANEDAA